MSLVIVMRFNRFSGAILGDEETWYARRRTFFANPIYSVLTPEQSRLTGVYATIGMTGNSSFAFEVISNVQKEITQRLAGGSRLALTKVNEIGQIALKAFQQCIKRRLDNRLQFLFGFTMDDYNRGYFLKGGERIDIRQTGIQELIARTVQWKDASADMEYIFGNEMLIAGYDPMQGFEAYMMNGKEQALYRMTGDFEAIGKGRDISMLQYADYTASVTLETRRKGVDQISGLIRMLTAANAAAFHVQGVGGYYQMAVIDGNLTDEQKRLRFIQEESMKIAAEATTGFTHGLLDQSAIVGLIQKLLFEESASDMSEKELFMKSGSPAALELLLRGYKIAGLTSEDMVFSWDAQKEGVNP